MKNADSPAMPIEINGFGQYAPEVFSGLTKREMFAMHAPKCPDWYDSNEIDTIRHIRWPVFYADLVLMELVK